MPVTRFTRVAAALVAGSLVGAACGKDEPAGPARVPTSVSAESPAMVAGAVGTIVASGASVIVRDQNGQPFSGATVTFTPAAGSGTVEMPTVRTNSRGVASSGKWTLGTASGTQRLIAKVARLDSVEFVASAEPGAPATLSVVGAALSATVGTALQTPPAVLVSDQYANPVPGALVTFAVHSGGGTASGLSITTAANGVAAVGGWTLGIRSGPQTLSASVGGLPPLVVTANAVAGPTEVLRLIAGSDGITQVGQAPAVAPAVLARDRHDNPVARRTLTVRVAQGGGTLAQEVMTDDTGIAHIGGWAMGPAEGLNAITVEVDGLSPLTIYAKAVPVSSYDIEFRFIGPVTERQAAAFNGAAARWRKVIIGDVPNVPVSFTSPCGLEGIALNEVIDDLLIYVQIVAIDGPGKILGSAGPCLLRGFADLPLVGFMRFDIADVEQLEATERFGDVALHEVGHILGIGSLWKRYGLLVDAGGVDPHYTGTGALAGFALAGGAAYGGNPVPVENTGGPGTRDGHWRESELNTEVMTGFAEAPGVRMPLSLTTIGSLEDLGYQVTTWGDDAYNYFRAGAFSDGVSASRVRVTTPDRELVEVPLPPPVVIATRGEAPGFSPSVAGVRTRRARVAEAKPRPVQEIEVRRSR